MNTRRRFCVVPLLFACLLHADEPAKVSGSGDFTRFVDDEKGAQLQTGATLFRNKDGVTVELIGAIHIADAAYYQKLDARFTRYDALLYEMVGESFTTRTKWRDAAKRVKAADPKKPDAAPPAQADPKAHSPAVEKPLPPPTEQDRKDVESAKQEEAAGGNLTWMHPLYDTMEKSLGLSGQLRGIHYDRPNFVHADMNLRQFAAMQKKKNESFLGLWWKTVQAQMEHPEIMPQQPGVLEILQILCSKDSATGLKRMVGRMFGSIEGTLSGLEDEGGSVILTERNKVALGVLRQQMSLGKKNLAIFYGAAHLPDMGKRLLAMGFQPVSHEWFTAWDIPMEARSESKSDR